MDTGFGQTSNSSSCGNSLVVFVVVVVVVFLLLKVFLSHSFEALRVFAKGKADMTVRVNPNFLSEKMSIDVLITHFSHGSVSYYK